VRAVGANGKKDLTPALVGWTVDLTPPDTRISGAPADPTTSRDATFSISASEAGSLACRLDDEAWAPCTTVVTRGDLAPGRHRFEARATDLAGLVDPTPAAYEWTIAAPPPATAPAIQTPPAADTPFVPALPTAPLPRVNLLALVGSVRVDGRRGRAALAVVCRGPGVCSGRLELRVSGRKLATVLVRLSAGKRKKLVFRIPRSARKALRARKVTLALTSAALTRLRKSRVTLLTDPVDQV
jgi:hypothetical protein